MLNVVYLYLLQLRATTLRIDDACARLQQWVEKSSDDGKLRVFVGHHIINQLARTKVTYRFLPLD